MIPAQRTFALGDILSITTGRLVSERHMDGIYDILNYMTGQNLFTHQIPRAMDHCRPVLEALYPALSHVALHDELQRLSAALKHTQDPDTVVTQWVRRMIEEHGAALEVPQLSLAEQFESPIADAIEMMGGDPSRVITLDIPRQEDTRP